MELLAAYTDCLTSGVLRWHAYGMAAEYDVPPSNRLRSGLTRQLYARKQRM
jgi:hypothetical protein